MRDKHVKDAAQDVAEDVTRDVAEGVLGAAEDGSHLLAGTCGLPPTAPHPTPPKAHLFINGLFIVITVTPGAL